MKPIKSFALGALAAVAGLAMAAAAVIYSGAYNVAATSAHSRPIERAFRVTMTRSVTAQARHVAPPPDFNAEDRQLAAHAVGHYEMMCRTCHGAPGRKPDPWQLYPAAPDLTNTRRGANWSDAEVFWIIKNGIKDTGMSAFGGSHSDEDLWALTALIRQLPAVTPEEYQTLSERPPARGKENAHQSGGANQPGQKDRPPPEEPPAHKH